MNVVQSNALQAIDALRSCDLQGGPNGGCCLFVNVHSARLRELQRASGLCGPCYRVKHRGQHRTAFIARLSLGSIAIAVAARNNPGDLFASAAIAVDKPFVVVDLEVIGGSSRDFEVAHPVRPALLGLHPRSIAH